MLVDIRLGGLFRRSARKRSNKIKFLDEKKHREDKCEEAF